jgi:hypothetical protein
VLLSYGLYLYIGNNEMQMPLLVAASASAWLQGAIYGGGPKLLILRNIRNI